MIVAISYIIFAIGFISYSGLPQFPVSDVIHWVLPLALVLLPISLLKEKMPSRVFKVAKWIIWVFFLSLLTAPLREYSWNEIEKQAYPLSFLSLFIVFDIFIAEIEKRISSKTVLVLFPIFFAGITSLVNLVSGSLYLGFISLFYLIGILIPLSYLWYKNQASVIIGSEKYLIPFFLLTAGHFYSSVPLVMNLIYSVVAPLLFVMAIMTTSKSEKIRDGLLTISAILVVSGGVIYSAVINIK